jgi:hypothetical protein
MMQRFVMIILVGVGFLLTIDIFLRLRQVPDAPVIKSQLSTAVTAPPVETAAVGTGFRYASQSETPFGASPTRSTQTAAPTAAQGDGATPAEPEEKYPPVSIHFPPSSDQAGIMVTLVNSFDGAQDLTVTAADPQTGTRSTVLISVAARSWANLTAAGLVVRHGDELTVESPGYSTRTGIIVP